jgi:hypothetical protein
VTAATALRPTKDVTAPLRSRRYRRKKNGKETKANVTAARDRGRVITTIEMCSLAARLSDGRAIPADLELAERVIMTFVDRLPPDSAIEVR